MNKFTSFVLLLCQFSFSLGINYPTFRLNAMNDPADFVPSLYQGPHFEFTSDIYIRIKAGSFPGHDVGIMAYEESFWTILKPDGTLHLQYMKSTGVPEYVNLGSVLSTETWYQLSIVHDPSRGIEYYVNGVKVKSIVGHPRLQPAGKKFYILQHLPSADSTSGTIYFRNLRIWKKAMEIGDIQRLMTENNMLDEHKSALLLYLKLNDNKDTAARWATFNDYGPNGMHGRGTNSNDFESISTDIQEYVPHGWALYPTTADISFDISQISVPASFALSFWMKYTTNENGAALLGGSGQSKCGRDVQISLIQNSNWYLRIQHSIMGTTRHYNDLKTAAGVWKYYFFSKDASNSAKCESWDINGGGAYGSYTCTNNNWLHFCDKLTFYKSLANATFQHFRIHSDYHTEDTANGLRLNQYSKYSIIYIYIYIIHV